MDTNINYLIAITAMISSVAHAAVGNDTGAADATLTREQVRAEVMRARAAGELDFNETNYPLMVREAPSTVTRAEVLAGVKRARLAGELDFNETNYPLSPKTGLSMLTRAEVRTAASRARAAGELDFTDGTYPLTVHATGL